MSGNPQPYKLSKDGSSTTIGSKKTTVVLAKPYNSISLINTLLEDTIDVASATPDKSKVSIPQSKAPGLIMTIVDHSISPSKMKLH